MLFRFAVLLLAAATAPTMWGFAPSAPFRPAHQYPQRGSFVQLNMAGMELADLISPAMMVAAALVVTIKPDLIPVEKIQKAEAEAETKVEETLEKVEEAVKEIVEAKVEEVVANKVDTKKAKEEKKAKEVKQVKEKFVKEETTPAKKVFAVNKKPVVLVVEEKEEAVAVKKEPVVVVEEKVEVVAVEEKPVVVVPEIPKPVASTTATPKTISQVKKEVASTLEGEREKQERIRLAAAKRELEKKEAAEAEGERTTVVTGEDIINGSLEKQKESSKGLRRKLFRVLKKSVAPWRKWENIK